MSTNNKKLATLLRTIAPSTSARAFRQQNFVVNWRCHTLTCIMAAKRLLQLYINKQLKL